MKILFSASLVLGLATGFYFTTEKIGKLVDNSKVTYNVGEDKLLTDAYKIEDAKNVLRLRGTYKENKRIGDWYCFDASGKMVLRYNYTVNKLLSLEQTELAALTIKVIDKDEDVATNARIPVPICAIDQYKSLMEEELKDQLPAKLKAAKTKISAEIVAMVDANGEAKYIAYYQANGVEEKVNVYLRDKLFSLEWLPAKYNEKTYKSEVKFTTTFELDPASTSKRFIWTY